MEILIPILLIAYLINDSADQSTFENEKKAQKEYSEISDKESFEHKHLYFFQNEYNLEIITEREESGLIKKNSIYNIAIDSSDVLKINNIKEDNQNTYNGTELKLQLLPNNTAENKFSLIYEIKINKNDYKNYKNEDSKYLKNNLFSKEEELIAKAELSLDTINYKKVKIYDNILTFKLNKIKYSNKFNSIEDMVCKNEICNEMKENTIKIKNYLKK